MDLKRCNRCKAEKERPEFAKNRALPDGLNGCCRSCDKEKSQARLTSGRRAISKLKEHGLGEDEARHWAAILTHPTSRCAICGIPQQILEAYTRHGVPHWILGRAKRLTLDHILPGVNNGDYRALCHACNTMRGAARFTDEEVLNEVRDKWRATIGLRFLWWLNTSPGVGGRLNRSDSCEKRDARFAAETPTTPPPLTTPPSSPSPSESPPADSAE